MKPTFTHTPNGKNSSKKSVIAVLALAGIIGAPYYYTKNSTNEILETADEPVTPPSPAPLQSTRATPTPDLRIQTLQRNLNKVVGCNLRVDGIQGNATRACTARYQRACMDITRPRNIGHAGDSTFQELAFHANNGKTLQTCKPSPQAARIQTVSVNHQAPSKQTRTSSSLQMSTEDTQIWLKPGQTNNPQHVRQLTEQLKILGCEVPSIIGKDPNDFTVAHQIALEALQHHLKPETFAHPISTQVVGTETFNEIHRLTGYYRFDDCTDTIEVLKARAALDGRL